MIPGHFNYLRPTSKQEALQMLADAGSEARPLAGGHSLIPMMKLRLAEPSALIDIGSISELSAIRTDGEVIEIGASTTQHALIESAELAAICPIIREAATQIADPQIRYCGTLGGNVGNGDPGNDMPGLMQCLGATYLLESTSGAREVAARDYYQGAYFTSLAEGEMITAIRIPKPVAGHGYAYKKLKRKIGDYATAAAAVILEMENGKVRDASIALTNLADTPLYATDAVAAIRGTALDAAAISAAVAAVESIVSPSEDGRGSVAYRTSMAGVMTRRALAEAASRAGEAAPRTPGQPSAGGSASNNGATDDGGDQKQGKGGLLGWLRN